MKIHRFNGQTNIVGPRVRLARRALQLSQDRLAAKLQTEGVLVEQKAVSRMEKQERVVTDYELLLLEKILDVDVRWLLSGDPKFLSERSSRRIHSAESKEGGV